MKQQLIQPDVLLVVDMQNGFLGSRSEHVIAPVVEVVRGFAKHGLPVVFTRFHNRPNSQYERLIGWTRLRSDEETQLHADLSTYATTIIDKDTYSAFTEEFIAMQVRFGWRTLAICGVATDGCVLKTATDAFERGLLPEVIADACASHAGEDVHNAGLLLLGRFVGKRQIVSRQEVLSAIGNRSSEHADSAHPA